MKGGQPPTKKQKTDNGWSGPNGTGSGWSAPGKGGKKGKGKNGADQPVWVCTNWMEGKCPNTAENCQSGEHGAPLERILTVNRIRNLNLPMHKLKELAKDA